MTKIVFIGDIHGKVNSPLGRLCDYNEDLFKKLEWIVDYCNKNNIDNIVHLGDIYDKPEAADWWKNKFIQTFRNYKGNFYSIIGKLHDLFHNNEQSYSKTCLYNLELSGILKVLKEPIRINEVLLYPLSMHIQQAKEQIKTIDTHLDASLVNVLLAHQFYEWDLDKSAGFTSDELEKIETSTKLVLGHDHRQHKSELTGHCEVIRPGSLMRTELSETTIEQKSRILLYDNYLWSYVQVPQRDINEIYDIDSYRLNKSNVKVFRQIENNIENISKYLHKEDLDIISCSQALKELNCPSEEFEYLKYVHQLCSQAF